MSTAISPMRSSNSARARPKRGNSRISDARADTPCAAIRQVSGPSPTTADSGGSTAATSAG
jgi:hypothetical protein